MVSFKAMTWKMKSRNSMLVDEATPQRWTLGILIGSQTYREKLAPFVVDAVPLMDDAQKKGANILVEGA